MTPREQYIAYISKHKLTGKAIPFTVAFDNNWDCWIVQLDNLQKIETDTNAMFRQCENLKRLDMGKLIIQQYIDQRTKRGKPKGEHNDKQ